MEKELKILLVEDTEEHEILIKEALARSAFKTDVSVARDGEEALDFIDKNPKPDVVLLDLRLPKIDGIEVLKRIRENERLKDLPIIVLTVSKRDEDIVKAFQHGIKSYLLKSTLIVEKSAGMERILDAILSLV